MMIQNKRNKKKLFVNINILVNRFVIAVLIMLSSSCSRVFVCARMIWLCGNITQLQSIMNSNQLITNVLKKTFGFARRDSMTRIFMYLSLPTVDTIVYNARILFVN